MNSDMLFPIIPRDNRSVTPQEDAKVRQVDKGPAMRQLNDEEKELKSEEKESRQKQQKKNSQTPSDESQDEQHTHSEELTTDELGQSHIDCYI